MVSNYGGEAKIQIYQSEDSAVSFAERKISSSSKVKSNSGEENNNAVNATGQYGTLWDFKMDLLDFEVLDVGDDGLKILSFQNEKNRDVNTSSSIRKSMYMNIDTDPSSKQARPIMSLSLTSSVVNNRPNMHIKLKFVPISLYYSFDFFERCGIFLNAIPKNKVIEKAAYETLENIQVWAEQEVSELVANRTKFDIEVKIDQSKF